MWPWEHAAVGYVLLSVGSRLVDRKPPVGPAVVALALATQVPDLVDKPLSWGLGWFPQGYALGHSALVALPVGTGLLLVGMRYEHRRVAAAFVLGHWSHLFGDVISPVRNGDPLAWERIMWPLVEQPPYPTDVGLIRGVQHVQRYVGELGTVDSLSLPVLYLGLTLATVGLWIVDGTPGVRLLAANLRALANALANR